MLTFAESWGLSKKMKAKDLFPLKCVSLDMAADLKKRKISSEAYQMMIMGGIFGADDKIELLDGEIVEMSPVGNPHIGIINWLNRYLNKHLPEETLVFVQNPIRLGEYSEPEPGLTVCRFQDHFYRNRKAKPEDIFLLIEVSDATLAKDREVKLPLYAEAGIPSYWIVNIPERQVEVYSEPSEGIYTKTAIYTEGDTLEFPEFDIEFLVKEMLG